MRPVTRSAEKSHCRKLAHRDCAAPQRHSVDLRLFLLCLLPAPRPLQVSRVFIEAQQAIASYQVQINREVEVAMYREVSSEELCAVVTLLQLLLNPSFFFLL